MSSLQEENIDVVNENIHIKQKKVHKNVVVPMIDYVPEILKKYNYQLPQFSSYRFNIRIKELGVLAKLNQRIEIVRKKGKDRVTDVFQKWELISSHTCRRSFCTNMYLSGFPAEELMKISGHKSVGAFMRYIKVDNLQAADRLKALRRGESRKSKSRFSLWFFYNKFIDGGVRLGKRYRFRIAHLFLCFSLNFYIGLFRSC